jgi:hypothetical protein
VDITSSTAASDTSYASFNGTSMATPQVSGVAALLKSRYPSAGVAELKNRLLASTRPLASLAGRTVSGGIVNAHGALTVAADGVLELRASAAVSPLSAGVKTAFFVTVTDLTPVLSATVTGALGTAPAVPFLDNGVAPDVAANDGVYSANLPVPSTGTSVTLNVTASAGGAPATGAFPFAIVNPPANDNFANRILLAAGTTQTTGTNRLSSRETGEPINPSVDGGRTVWWEWVAATSGSATITTVGSNYDTTLAIYSGSGTLGSLVHLGSNDDAIGLASSVTFTATTGQRYYVQVDGYSGGTGDITLNYPSPLAVNAPPSIVTPPVGAILVEGDPLSLSVTASGTLPLSYQWRLNGTPIGGATSATYSVAAVAAAHAGSYTVTITNTFGTITGGPAVVVVDPISVRPSNDAFAAAEVLPGATGRVNGTNQRASGETGEPNHAGASTPLESVWYRWTAPANGTLAVDTYGSSLDTTLAVYTGSAVNALTLRGSNNDSGGLQSFVSVPVTAGQVLSIAVDGVGTLESIFSLNYHFQPAVVGVQNDEFANRTVVPGAPGTITGTNIGATGEVGEPVHSPLASPLASVWWAWTAPASGVAVIDTLGSDFDSVLAVYTGSSVAALTPVASNDDAGGPLSRLTFPCVAGMTYAIAVDGRGTAQGNITLRIVSGASEPEIVVEEPVGTGLVDGTSTVNFGSVVTTGSASRVFTVRNTGGAALTSLALSVTGANAGDFAITTQPSAPLAGGGVTTFTVRFAPGAPGARSAALRIASNDADENPFDIALTGTGIVAAPEIAVEQPSGTNLTDGVSTVNFGYSVVSGTASRTFTVRNTGNATLSGVSVSIGGTNAADFTVTTPPTATVAAGANTSFTVRFSPGATGARTATLAISSNDADENPFDLTLNGNGTAEPPIVRTINTTDRGWYGSNGFHGPTNDNYFTGYDPANSPPELRSFFVFAIPVMAPEETLISAELQLFNPAGGFSSSDATETLEIREVTTPTASLIAGTGGVAAFTDLGDGLLYGPLAVSSANNGGTVTIPLGNGFAAAVLARSGSDIALGGSLSTITRTRNEFVFGFTGGTGTPTQLVLTSIVTYTAAEIAVEQPVGTSLTDGGSTVNFGITATGTTRDLTFTIRNPGIANLTGLGITIDGANPGDFTVITPPTAPVAPGGSTTFIVRFNPSAASVRTAALHIASNDPNEGSFDIALTGRGYTAPVGLDFQIVSMGSTGAAVVDHDAITSDERGGIAVSTDRVFVTGDSATSRHALANLSGGASIGRVSNGLCSDIGTGIVYVLANNGVETPGGGTINQLIELDPLTGALMGNIIPLSSSITLSSDSGVFSGNGRVVLHNGTNVFDILVPSGVVTNLGAMTRPAWYRSESWAILGCGGVFRRRISPGLPAGQRFDDRAQSRARRRDADDRHIYEPERHGELDGVAPGWAVVLPSRGQQPVRRQQRDTRLRGCDICDGAADRSAGDYQSADHRRFR